MSSSRPRPSRPGQARFGAALFGGVLIALVLGLPVFAAVGPTKLESASVTPRTGSTTTVVDFQVTYRNVKGLPPDYVRVRVGTATTYAMSSTGTDWKAGVVFTVSTRLAAGLQDVTFEARDTEKFPDVLAAGTVDISTAPPSPTPAPTATAAPTSPPSPTQPPASTPQPTQVPREPAPTATVATAAPGATASPAGSSPPSSPTGTGAGGTGDGSTTGTGGTSGSGPSDLGGSGGFPGGDWNTSGAHDAWAADASTGSAGAGRAWVGDAWLGSLDEGGGAAPGGVNGPAGGTPGGNAGAAGSGGAGGGPADDATLPGGTGLRGHLVARAAVATRTAADALFDSTGSYRPTSSWLVGPLGAGLTSLGWDLHRPSFVVGLIGSSATAAVWMAFALFGKRRRDETLPAPPSVLAASAGQVAPALAVAPVAEPLDPESLMPRWRRPSLLEARRTDPARAPARVHQALSFSSVSGGSGQERRVIRYAVAPLLDRPDELAGVRLGDLSTGDEVELIDRSGAFWLVSCPDGRQGWLHRMTLGDVVVTRQFEVADDEVPDGQDALRALLAARGLG